MKRKNARRTNVAHIKRGEDEREEVRRQTWQDIKQAEAR